MFRKTALFFTRQQFKAPLRQSPRFFATQANNTNAAAGTNKNTPPPQSAGNQQAQRVALFPEIRKVLKQQVIDVLENKGDELLIKKLNFLGPEGVARLNCASSLVLNTLSDENCFRIMSQELMDNWDYYWVNIKKSGDDPAKWMENMKEVAHLPFIMDKCFNRMQLHGVNPSMDHYLAYIDCMANYGIGPQAGKVIIDLKKQNYARKDEDTTPTRVGLLRAWKKHVSNEIPLIFYEYFTKDNPTDIPQDLRAHFQQLEKEQAEEAPIADYFFGPGFKDKTKPEILKKREQDYEEFAGKWLQQEMLDQYLQPPLEKLHNVDDMRREQLEKENKKNAKK